MCFLKCLSLEGYNNFIEKMNENIITHIFNNSIFMNRFILSTKYFKNIIYRGDYMKYYCPQCGNNIECIIGCGATGYFCNKCKRLISSKEVLTENPKKEDNN